MARAAATPQIMVALTGFVGAIKDGEVFVRKGDRFPSDDPIVKKWPELFGPLTLRDTVESATAAPGEKRGAA